MLILDAFCIAPVTLLAYDRLKLVSQISTDLDLLSMFLYRLRLDLIANGHPPK